MTLAQVENPIVWGFIIFKYQVKNSYAHLSTPFSITIYAQ